MRRLQEQQPGLNTESPENVRRSVPALALAPASALSLAPALNPALAPAPSELPANTGHVGPASNQGRLLNSQSGQLPRYVDGGFWATLEAETADWVDDTDQPSALMWTLEDPETQPGPFASLGAFSRSTDDLSRFHPRPDRVFPLWQVYLEAVDPLLKIIHVPTTQRQLLQASQDLDSIPPSFEALMFAVFYAAVTSMQTSVTLDSMMVDERYELLDKYGSGVEQALSKARFMTHPDIFSLQALTLFLVCARNHLNRSLVWTMTGTAIRLATKLGVHRELELPPFECEMRRRLWWQLVVLDVLTAQDNDADPSIHEHSFTTSVPRNVDDHVLDIIMSTPADNSPGRTEMLFPLRTIELARTARRVLFSDSFTASNAYRVLSYEERLKHVADLEATLRAHDETHLDQSTAICSMTRRFTSVETSRMTIVLQHLAQPTNKAAGMATSTPPDGRVIFNQLATLRAQERQRRWLWLVQRDPEWEAAASMLHSLITDSEIENSSGVRQAVEEFFQRWAHYTANSMLDGRWQLLKRLYTRAQRVNGDLIGAALHGECRHSFIHGIHGLVPCSYTQGSSL